MSCLIVSLGVALPAGATEVSNPTAGDAVRASAADPTAPRVNDDELRPLLEEIVSEQLDAHEIPGAAVSVVKPDGSMFTAGYGESDLDVDRAVDPERTGFATASLAKLFTTVAVLQLAAEGKVELDRDVNRYLDDVRIENTYPGEPVTLHHLLTHTGGFDEDLLGTSTGDPAKVQPLAEYVEKRQPERRYRPGTVLTYDNYGFDLAALVVQDVSGERFDEYLRQHVFEPLGMTRTTARNPAPKNLEKALAQGYLAGPEPSVRLHSGAVGSGAGPITTAADMGRFVRAVLTDDPRLGDGVARAMREQQYVQQEGIPGMAYGLQHKAWRGTDVLFKAGDVPGFHSAMALVPSANLGVYVVYNGDGDAQQAPWYAEQLLRKVVTRYAPAENGARENGAAKDGAAGDGDVSRYEGTYVSNRTSQNSLLKISNLVGSVNVTASGPGELTTTGLSADPSSAQQHWTRVAPGRFVQDTGYEQIAFDDGLLTSTVGEASTLGRVSGLQSPSLHMTVFMAGGGVLALGWLAFGLLPLRRFRGRAAHPGGARAARALAWLAGGLGVAFLSVLLPVVFGSRMNEMVLLGSGVFLATKILGLILLWFVLFCLVAAVLSWWRRWWSIAGRLGYSAFVLGGVAFVAVALTYNLVLMTPYLEWLVSLT